MSPMMNTELQADEYVGLYSVTTSVWEFVVFKTPRFSFLIRMPPSLDSSPDDP